MPITITIPDSDVQKLRHLMTDKEWTDVPTWQLLGIVADILEIFEQGAFRAEFESRLSTDTAEIPTVHNHPSHDRGSCPICHTRGHGELECGLW